MYSNPALRPNPACDYPENSLNMVLCRANYCYFLFYTVQNSITLNLKPYKYQYVHMSYSLKTLKGGYIIQGVR